MKAFVNGKLIDGAGRVLDKSVISFKGSRFTGVQAAAEAPGIEGQVFDIQGLTVLPGLIDCHVHLCLSGEADPFSALPSTPLPLLALKFLKNAQSTLESGITTVRDQGAMGFVDFSVRRAAEEGLFNLPRLVLSGRCITMTGGHGWLFGGREADGPDEVRKAVREQVKAGADSIKVIASGGMLTQGSEPGGVSFSFEEMKAAAEEAHRAGRRISAHAHSATAVKNAVKAGFDSIEHAMFMDEEALDMMCRSQIYYVPTLCAPLRTLEDSSGSVPKWLIEIVSSHKDRIIHSVKSAHERGLGIALGSDAGTPLNPHGQNLKELEFLVGLGMSPLEAISAATKRGAETLGLDKEIGTVEPGKQADFIVVKKDPLADIGCLTKKENILYVVKGGEILKSPD